MLEEIPVSFEIDVESLQPGEPEPVAEPSPEEPLEPGELEPGAEPSREEPEKTSSARQPWGWSYAVVKCSMLMVVSGALVA